MGSRALRDHVADETAWTVERYIAAGLIICGRTNTAEFGNHCATEPSLFGPTLNLHGMRTSRPADRVVAQPPRSPPVSSPQLRAATARARRAGEQARAHSDRP
jgi:hypothetical protein